MDLEGRLATLGGTRSQIVPIYIIESLKRKTTKPCPIIGAETTYASSDENEGLNKDLCSDLVG